MTKIYVIRHAEAEGNLYRRVHGVYDSLITENGFRQVASLEKRFQGINVDAVYSSDLARTKQTAAGVYAPKKLPLYTTKLLREENMGIWEDVPWGEIERVSPELLYEFNHNSLRWHVEGCESFDEAGERMLYVIGKIAQRHEGGSAAVVTHGSALRALLYKIAGISEKELVTFPYSDNTAVSLIEAESGRFRIVYANDNSHLPEEFSTFARQHWWKSDDGVKRDMNMRFEPLCESDIISEYTDAYADAWKIAHGSLTGFDPIIYSRIAGNRIKKYPDAIVRSFVGEEASGLIDLDIDAEKDENVGCIAFYYIKKGFRGRGVGVQLLGQAVSVYRALGREKLRLRVAESNTGAIRFYERYGFAKTGEQRGAAGKLFVMEKSIGIPETEGEIRL